MFGKSITTLALALLAGTAAPARSQDKQAAEGGKDSTLTGAPVHETRLTGPGRQSYWGFGLGYVFNRIPISMSTFNVGMTDLWYSYIFGDPNDNTRIAGTMGFYGFEFMLPVPRVSADFYIGKPSQDVQGKIGVGGFYDVAVGGHGGLSGSMGVVLKDRVDISFLFVPVGSDSKRSYAEFLGTKTKAEALEDYKDAGNRYVELPYYGVFVGLRF